jgi:glycosyltransferase involved in cell wall biosynthesis
VPVSYRASEARERLVVTVGRLWDQAKNAALLARAAGTIDGRVLLVGPGDVPGMSSLGELEERHVFEWLSRAAVFAEPARYEPFGLSALEAALCGCALVLGDIPTLREVWGDAAWFVPVDDPVALAHAINSILADPLRRSRMAADAGSVASLLTPTAMAASYLDTYRRVSTMTAAAA